MSPRRATLGSLVLLAVLSPFGALAHGNQAQSPTTGSAVAPPTSLPPPSAGSSSLSPPTINSPAPSPRSITGSVKLQTSPSDHVWAFTYATVGGIVGIPLGFYLNRRIERRTSAAQQREAARTMAQIIERASADLGQADPDLPSHPGFIYFPSADFVLSVTRAVDDRGLVEPTLDLLSKLESFRSASRSWWEDRSTLPDDRDAQIRDLLLGRQAELRRALEELAASWTHAIKR